MKKYQIKSEACKQNTNRREKDTKCVINESERVTGTTNKVRSKRNGTG